MFCTTYLKMNSSFLLNYVSLEISSSLFYVRVLVKDEIVRWNSKME